MIETFLLEQNLAKRTRQVWRSSDFRVRRHETTCHWAEKHKEFLAPIRIENYPDCLELAGKNVSPGALLAPLCFSLSPFSFAGLDFPLLPRSAPGFPRMLKTLFFLDMHILNRDFNNTCPYYLSISFYHTVYIYIFFIY